MGVLATYCQLCGLPVQHDHYVPEAVGQMLKIYRGGQEGGGHTWEPGEEPFLFKDEHTWLRDAVGLPLEEGAILRGPVEDGELTDKMTGNSAFVADGMEDCIVFHERCWEILGKPKTADESIRALETQGWKQIEPYQGQLFEFKKLRQDGHAWMLVDPAGRSADGVKSRARIQAMLDAAKSG